MATFMQSQRRIGVTTKLGKDVLLLRGFTGEEGISMPFRFTLSMFSENGAIDGKGLLHTHATIEMAMAGGDIRYIDGLVSRFRQGGITKEKLTSYEIEILPWLSFLSLRESCRIFQNKSVPDIIEAIFKELGFTDYSIKTMGSYQPREYCVQYRESDLAFVSRLMEEEGIFYFFEHASQKHTLVLADNTSSIQPCPFDAKVRYYPGAAGFADENTSSAVELEQAVHVTKVTLTDYDFEKPSTSLASSSGDDKWESYDYPGEYLTKGDADRYSRLRLESVETMGKVLRGTSDALTLQSGCKFDLVEHYRSDVNGSYQLLRVTHRMTGGGWLAGDSADAQYENDFVAIPAAVPFRPPRVTPRPVVYGPQTAVVVGKSGEEIWVDKYGRVKVQFFWDRDGKKDDKSSCWVRVASTSAGKNWGFVTIPRIGQEVIVDFLEGDPDRPLIVGRVYNAEQMPPYTLPGNQTQSGFKSRSSKGGGTENFNELRFEDKKGSEQIFLHAEKDMVVEVENDRNTTIGNNETKEVTKGNETITIKKGNQSLTIEMGNQSVTLNQGNQSIVLKMGDQSTELDMGNVSTTLKMGNMTTKLNLGKSETEAMQSIELKVGQSSVKVDQMGVHIKGMMIDIQAQVQAQLKAIMTQVQGEAMLIEKGGLTMIN